MYLKEIYVPLFISQNRYYYSTAVMAPCKALVVNHLAFTKHWKGMSLSCATKRSNRHSSVVASDTQWLLSAILICYQTVTSSQSDDLFSDPWYWSCPLAINYWCSLHQLFYKWWRWWTDAVSWNLYSLLTSRLLTFRKSESLNSYDHRKMRTFFARQILSAE